MSGSPYEPLRALTAAICVTVALSGCGGGGSGGGRPVTPGVLELPPGHGLGAGVIMVAADTSEVHGNVVVTCPAGASACVVTVSADGTAEYARTGGVPRVAPVASPWGVPMGHGLMAGRITVAAGASAQHGNVVVTCPAGGSACVVTVSADGTTVYAVTGGTPTFMFAHRSYERDNPTAADLLDHWDQPEPLRAALGLSAVNAADLADRTKDLSDLINMAGGDPNGTGTRLRNVRPEDVEIIGERDGITYGQWKGGPAGTLNIEFDWRFAENFDAKTRAGMERAGKSWSRRLLDDFGTNVVRQGREIRYNDNTESVVLDEDVPLDGVLIFMIDRGDSRFSSAGARTRDRKTPDDDYQPWLGLLRLSQRHVDATGVMAHEVGHVIGVSGWDNPPLSRYVNTVDHTFEGPEAMRANGEAPLPFQWVDGDNQHVSPHTTGAEVDYGHFGVCTSIMAYCRDRAEVYLPSAIDFAYLADVGYEILDAQTASEPELYGYGAWGRYSAWGAGVERTLQFTSTDVDDAHDTLRAGADAFGMAPSVSLAEANMPLQGGITWSGSLIGVDLAPTMPLPPVFGDAELQVQLSTLQGTALFDDLTVHVDGVSSPFRAPRLEYDIGVTENAFSDADGRVLGRFYGPAHEEMAGVLHDDTPSVNLLAGFGGKR